MNRLIVSSILLFCMLVPVFALSNGSVKSFTLQGMIIGKNSGRIILEYRNDQKYVQDTVRIKYGKFVFKGKIIEPVQATIYGNLANPSLDDSNSTTLYLEPGVMNVILRRNKFKELKMKGSKTQDEMYRLNLQRGPIQKKIDGSWTEFYSVRDSLIKKNKYSEFKNTDINISMSRLGEQLDTIDIRYVLSNPASYLSPYLLERLDLNEVISLDSLKSVYGKLDVSIQNSIKGKEIMEDIVKKEKSFVGAMAPEFKATDLNSQQVVLSKFREKKVVLLNFWASWCYDCRNEVPYLKKIYETYGPKGLEIIAVSLDTDRSAWISTVKADSTEMWHHIPVAEKYADGPDLITKDDIYANYFVLSVPVQLLIDKSGKIVGRWIGSTEENEKELEDSLSKLFLDQK